MRLSGAVGAGGSMNSTGLWESPSMNTFFVHARNRCACQPLEIESNSIAKFYALTNIRFYLILTVLVLHSAFHILCNSVGLELHLSFHHQLKKEGLLDKLCKIIDFTFLEAHSTKVVQRCWVCVIVKILVWASGDNLRLYSSTHIQYLSGDSPLVNVSNSAVCEEVAVCIAH